MITTTAKDRLAKLVEYCKTSNIRYRKNPISDKRRLSLLKPDRYVIAKSGPGEWSLGGCSHAASYWVALAMGDIEPRIAANGTGPTIPRDQRGACHVLCTDNIPDVVCDGIARIDCGDWAAVCKGYDANFTSVGDCKYKEVPEKIMEVTSSRWAIVHYQSGHVVICCWWGGEWMRFSADSRGAKIRWSMWDSNPKDAGKKIAWVHVYARGYGVTTECDVPYLEGKE